MLCHPAAVRREGMWSRSLTGRHPVGGLGAAPIVPMLADRDVIWGPDLRYHGVGTMRARGPAGPTVEVHGWVVTCRCGWYSRSATREGAEMLAEHHRRLDGRHDPVINEQ
jgi:hypothetical protein